MFTIKDENNVLYKYGLSNYLKKVEENIQKDFPDFEPKIEIEVAPVSTTDNDGYTIMVTLTKSNTISVVQEQKYSIPKLSIVNYGGIFRNQISVPIKFIGDTSLMNYFAIVLLIRTLYRNKEGYPIDLSSINTDIIKYWAPSTKNNPSIKDNPEIFLLGDTNWQVAVREEVMHYRASSAKSLNALVNVEFDTEKVGTAGLKGEIIQKTTYNIITDIFNSAMAAGLEFVVMKRYVVFMDLNNNFLTLKIVLNQDIDNNTIKEVEFRTLYMIFPNNKYLVNPKKAIAQLMINMYLWYQTSVNHITSIDEEEFSIFKDAIMCNIDVNV